MHEPSAVEWLRRLEARELSARELSAHYLERIEAVNDAVNAVTAHDPTALLKQADDADRARARGDRRPLLGLPVTVKDSLATTDLPTTGGSLARVGHRPARDATVVSRLRAAGALILAKTNVPEYCWSFECRNLVHGVTVNPHDPERTCGGSSGGEGAIQAADASPVGIGTDGGGSIRVPSHYCGVVGLRPTTGVVPETGHWPATRGTGCLDTTCVGPMGRFVADLELLLGVIAGPDWVDPYAVPVRLEPAPPSGVRGLRVAAYAFDGRSPVTGATRDAVANAAGALADAGCVIVEAAPAGVEDATELFFSMMAADGGAAARRDLAPAGGRIEPALARLLDELSSKALSADEYFAVLRRAFALRARVRGFFDGFAAAVCPVTAGPAPRHGHWPGETAGASSFEAFNYTHTYSLAGLPVAVVPAGEDEAMPIGVQIVCAPYREHVALALAREVELRLGGAWRARLA
jgi:Asp-tRNA(Asn)/Glu-tRNA(Gln) amidotransferase A subunit family amidase